ncbi:MAG: autotransporter-associated beta strand repeat-containing protein [Kiritimatiellae bacterium]|nr:autotransporter-associated beta strand repeat-containing protein [Kiritimatiellia bacterium]
MKKAKSPLAIALALAATAGWATDFVWTGASTAVDKTWADAANWTVNGAATDTWPQTAEDTATFNTECVPVRNEEATVGEIILNADVTLRFDKWLTVGKISGTGKLILKNRGRIRNINGTAVEFGNDIEIIAPDGTDWDHRDAMPWIQGNGANFDIKGKLIGDGHIFFTMAGNYGVRLYGDNSGFSGTIHVDSNNSNRMKFGEAQSGFENGKLMLYGSVNDNGSMLFSNGVIHFGSIYTKDYATGAKFRSIDKNNTLIVGNLNSPDDRITLGMGNDADTKAKIIKVGTGTLELGPTRHRNGTIISNGTIRVTHPDGICHKNSDLVFDGGTLQYGVNPLDENNPVTKDVSAYVKGSSGFISVDTDGHDITWANGAMYNNNADAKGFVKKGEGTLELSGSNRDGTWQFFSDETKTNIIEGGTLAIRNAKFNSRFTLASTILGTGTLKICSEEANGGVWLHGTEALADFEGTLDWANELSERVEGGAAYASGFRMADHINFEMPKAKMLVSGNPAEPTNIMKGETQGNAAAAHVTVGAYEHLHPNAQVYVERSAWTLNILGTAGDSYLNGVFTGDAVHILKTGAGKLTMGPGFSAPEGSTINVNEGVFAMVAGMKQADLPSYVNIAEGVAFTGDGVFDSVDLAKHDVVPPAGLTAETDHSTVFTLLTATSITGESAAMAKLLQEVNSSIPNGVWKVKTVKNIDGTVSLKCSWARKGFMVTIR